MRRKKFLVIIARREKNAHSSKCPKMLQKKLVYVESSSSSTRKKNTEEERKKNWEKSPSGHSTCRPTGWIMGDFYFANSTRFTSLMFTILVSQENENGKNSNDTKSIITTSNQ